MKVASLPDGTKLAFEDSTPQSVIDAKVKEYIALKKTPAPSPAPNISVTVPEIRMPEINIPAQPDVKVEIIQESPKQMDEMIATLKQSSQDSKALIKAIDELTKTIVSNTKTIQTEVRAASVAIIKQMDSTSGSVTAASDKIYSALTKNKSVEFDLQGNPIRIKVDA